MDGARARGLPPKLGIKKRKPRASSVVESANGRVRKESRGGAPTWPSRPWVDGFKGQAHAHVDLKNSAVSDEIGSFSTPCGPPGRQSDAESVKRKGLRHFAVRVSRKVEEKNLTTYNEVADELVVEEKEIKQQEMEAGGKNAATLQKKLAKNGTLVDEKNIRRRVYDSLNVLMAMSIISKDKKLIAWRGIDAARGGSGPGAVEAYRHAIEFRKESLENKRRRFMELEDQATTLASLIRRNARDSPSRHTDSSGVSGAPKGVKTISCLKMISKSRQQSTSKAKTCESLTQDSNGDGDVVMAGSVEPSSSVSALRADEDESRDCDSESSVAAQKSDNRHNMIASDRVQLPFVIVAASEKSKIELQMNDDRDEVSFTFSSEFSALDDREVLRRISRSPRLPNV